MRVDVYAHMWAAMYTPVCTSACLFGYTGPREDVKIFGVCVSLGWELGMSGWAVLGCHPCRPRAGSHPPAGLRGVGGQAAEASVPMETAGFRILLAPVLVQMGRELGVGVRSREGHPAALHLTPSIVLSVLRLPPYRVL